MTNACIVTGTDTDVGKTVFAAMLLLALSRVEPKAAYWKPLQSGVTEGVDTKTVQSLTGLPDAHFYPEKHVFSEPLSPHRAAELDGVLVDPDVLELPRHHGPLLIEGAGGLLVPVTRDVLQIDMFARWGVPVILCARTGLGTINHTLLSIEALRARTIPIHGIAFIGEDNADNMQTIADFSEVPVLGRMPYVPEPDRHTLLAAFDAHFRIEDFWE